ncbi:phosphatase PAP2 family protein [Blastococcus sp. VKM Ac-2987]|uniref:phosphatase PAP2 family protein n=1 Tax=Blastococcus sp. VKM Ac-2987 TaxID=3004141 RepID=UPI0022ABB2BB|nr:phosphatase PAP2 family protein [Blastococcus sp. VKM Ac-2987]MCZ2860277.1 phosphatase PAP2 family protein [Blastococcus sp. VKM Ac-2987]
MTAVDPPAPVLAGARPAPEQLAGLRLPGRPARARLVTWVLWTCLGVAFAGTCAVRGLPTDRVVLLGWVLAGLGVSAATQGWRRLVRLLVDWLPLAAVLLAYDATRGLADGLGMPVHVTEPADADRWLGGGVLPTVWLQENVRADWWKALATLVYSSHFVVTPVVLAVLWLRDRARWARCARLVVALSLAGLVTYVLYPAAPPWLAAKEGVIEPVGRVSSAGWEVLGLPRAGVLLATSQGQVNLVAAVPSLHTAFAVLMCMVLLPLARRTWQRVALVAYAVLMPLVLVWSGEHYVVDTLLGAAYACGVVLLAPPAGRLVRAGVRRAALPWRA